MRAVRHASVTPEAVLQGAPYPVHARPTPSIGPLTPPLLLKAPLRIRNSPVIQSWQTYTNDRSHRAFTPRPPKEALYS
ncbi:hypothetical protein HPB50_005999 [Hyalomma asiaticum]|uniref:Uncharacterized protein n=1 Tax=Hyalomma asiaticum TaxID=266040 RepID=A0ACB7S4P6_HYAAI|nr:hypothetical protein HPB50_005999 [Hyalomma asiaticum]